MATRTLYWVNCDKVERDTVYTNVFWVIYFDKKVYSLNFLEFRKLVCTGSFDVEVVVDNRKPQYSCYICGRDVDDDHKLLKFEVEQGQEMPVCDECYQAFRFAWESQVRTTSEEL